MSRWTSSTTRLTRSASSPRGMSSGTSEYGYSLYDRTVRSLTRSRPGTSNVEAWSQARIAGSEPSVASSTFIAGHPVPISASHTFAAATGSRDLLWPCDDRSYPSSTSTYETHAPRGRTQSTASRSRPAPRRRFSRRRTRSRCSSESRTRPGHSRSSRVFLATVGAGGPRGRWSRPKQDPRPLMAVGSGPSLGLVAE